MSDERRHGSFVWPTWIAPLLAGDRHCKWAAWYRAHFQYAKVPEDTDGAARLKKWKGDHADAVTKRVRQLSVEGWEVLTESQNRMSIRGKVATLGGCPDIVALRDRDVDPSRAFALTGIEPSSTASSIAVVEDIKTGARKDSDFWQVIIYMLFAAEQNKRLKGRTISGAVLYEDGTLPIGPQHAGPEALARVVAQIQETGGSTPPERTPSVSECRFCDILACPDRLTEDSAPIDTELF